MLRVNVVIRILSFQFSFYLNLEAMLTIKSFKQTFKKSDAYLALSLLLFKVHVYT
jgi:hypothetical protein